MITFNKNEAISLILYDTDMKRIYLVFLATFLITPIAVASPYSLSSTIYLGSDYVFRGISQTDNNPSFQAGLDGGHETGLMAGLFTSNVDFNSSTKREFDAYLAYSHAFGSDASVDLAASQYTYTHENNLNYTEYMLGFHYMLVDIKIWYADDYSGTGGAQHYYEINFSTPVSNNFTLDLQTGYTDFSPRVGIANYSDYSIALSKDYPGFSASLLATANNQAGSNDGSIILITLSKSFNLLQ